MKKQLVAFALMLALLAAAAAWLFLGNRVQPSGEARLTPDKQRDYVQAKLTYDAGTRTLRGTQHMRVSNRGEEALSEIVLRLPMNAQDAACTSVTDVRAHGERVSFSQDEEDASVLRADVPLLPGETAELSFTLMIRHEKAEGAAVITLPTLAMLEDGVWRTDAYDERTDPSFAQAFDYVLELSLRDDVAAAFGGRLIAADRETEPRETLYTVQMQGARDVSFALLSSGTVRQQNIGGVAVTALAESASAAFAMLEYAKTALESLEQAGFSYPFDALGIAFADTGRSDGLALSGMAVLPGEAKKEAQIRRITRLAARQTFGILVESDPFAAPWLSISLASAAEMLAYRARCGEKAYETRFFEELESSTRLTRPAGVCVGASTAFFGSDAEMTQVLRDQGAAMLLGIERAVGEAAFCAALQAYGLAKAGSVAERADLEAALQAATGSDWSGYLEDELSF